MSWHYDGEIRIKKLEIQPFGANCYIVVCPQSGEGIIIDTPGEAARILGQIEDIKVRYIIITHSHLDHLGAFQEVRDKLKAPVAIHPLEAEALPSPPDLTLEDGDVVNFGTVGLRVLHTPGHTPDSISLYSPRYRLLVVGDALVKRRRTLQFPYKMVSTNLPQAIDSVRKMAQLEVDIICFGHGRPVTEGAQAMLAELIERSGG